MIVQESAWGMTQVKGSEKVPATPSMPTGTRQYLNQECPSTRNTSESQHILAKYTRYLKSCSKGKSVTLHFSANLSAFSSCEKCCDLHLSGHTNRFHKRHIKKFGTSDKLQLCKFTGVSYKWLSFNHNASIKIKTKYFGKSLPNL